MMVVDATTLPLMGDWLESKGVGHRYQLGDGAGSGFTPFAAAGSMLLVLRTGQTDRKLAQAKLTTLDRLPVRLIGTVLNDIQAEGMYKYYAYLDGYGTLDEDDEPRLVQAGGGSSVPARRG